jgi:hypothetical protein
VLCNRIKYKWNPVLVFLWTYNAINYLLYAVAVAECLKKISFKVNYEVLSYSLNLNQLSILNFVSLNGQSLHV